jgi:hypothetical protein
MSRFMILAITAGGWLMSCSSDSAGPAHVEAAAIVADHSSATSFADIPTNVIEQIKTDYHIFYGHTSHGSQVVTGKNMLAAENSLYTFGGFTEYSDDLGTQGDTSWVPITRQYLNQQGNNFNMVMWSWCGGQSDNTEAGVSIYLQAMERLEADYPAVTFVYMTGHLDGGGPTSTVYLRNNQVRQYCRDHNKVLFDFADIESYDPAGTYYPNESDACGWCTTWCSTHDCPSCGECAHSHCFNCYRKGEAWWWLMARVAGWNGSTGVLGGIDGTLPVSATLAANYPNPFNPTTTIAYSLPRAGEVTLEIVNVTGQRVRRLVSGLQSAGEHTVVWNGADETGDLVASGVYLYRLGTDMGNVTKKMLLLK